MKHKQSNQPSKSEIRRGSRRSFLRKSVVAGGGLASASALSSEALAEQAPEQETQQEGYRLTEHIAEYYKTAKL